MDPNFSGLFTSASSVRGVGTALRPLNNATLQVSGEIVCDSLTIRGGKQGVPKKSSLAHYLKQARLRK